MSASASLGPGLLGRASAIKGLRTLNGQAEVAWFYRQIVALSEGRAPNLSLRTWPAMLAHFSDELRLARARGRR